MHSEGHSIDFVPLSERYGTPARLFTIWLSINLSIICAAVGVLGPTSGLPLGWSLLGIVIGNAVGTAVMAAHSAQGPTLGIPQMIQSRAQFGVRGAALPLVAVVITYTLYTAADGLIVEGSLRSLFGGSNTTVLIGFGAVTLFIAYMGYELIHRIGAFFAVTSVLLFAVAAWRYLSGDLVVSTALPAAAAGHYTSAGLLVMIAQAAAWTLSFGPYVADYSRYLPPDVRPSATFWSTALGCFIGTTLLMGFGAYLASLSPALGADLGGAVAQAFGRLRPVAELLVVFGVLQGNVMNLYSAYMSTVTIFSGMHDAQRIGQRQKLWILAILMAAATLISLVAQDDFQTYFADILNVMLYLLVPWSSINLADYYLVRHGGYEIADMYRPHGQYRSVRWDTIAIYLLGIAAQVPFMNLSFFQGPVARWLGADMGWLPGLIVTAALFVHHERRVVAQQVRSIA
jgi:NCS1 family nucleobase:cation symporter-1